ncbi:hypothetical protein HUJ04_004883 [Dendroctonus ponderosae]|nr:hypothetical protein HUJ04_004883 [Dendroctonus ponderosae]
MDDGCCDLLRCCCECGLCIGLCCLCCKDNDSNRRQDPYYANAYLSLYRNTLALPSKIIDLFAMVANSLLGYWSGKETQ